MKFQSEKYETEYNNIKEMAKKEGYTEDELNYHYFVDVESSTKSKRIRRMLRLAHYLGWLRGIKYCDEIFYTEIYPSKARCHDAFKQNDGSCLGYQRTTFDDEPIDACKKCDRFSINYDEAMPPEIKNGGKTMDLTPKNKVDINSSATSLKVYEIDFEKVKTIEDIKGILKAINTTVNVVFYKGEQIKGIDHLLKVKE